FFFFQAEDGIRDFHVTGVQTCALPISRFLRQRARDEHTPPLAAAQVANLPVAQVGQPNALQRRLDRLPVFAARPAQPANLARARSEERRVGKGWMTWWS